MLAPDLESPPVPNTSVGPDLLQALQVLTELVIQGGRDDLAVPAVLEVLPPVQDVVGNLEGPWVGHDDHELVDLLLGELTGPLGRVDLGLLQGNVAETPSNTLDRGQGKASLLLSVDVRVSNTNHVLEGLLVRDEGLRKDREEKTNGNRLKGKTRRQQPRHAKETGRDRGGSGSLVPRHRVRTPERVRKRRANESPLGITRRRPSLRPRERSLALLTAMVASFGVSPARSCAATSEGLPARFLFLGPRNLFAGRFLQAISTLPELRRRRAAGSEVLEMFLGKWKFPFFCHCHLSPNANDNGSAWIRGSPFFALDPCERGARAKRGSGGRGQVGERRGRVDLRLESASVSQGTTGVARGTRVVLPPHLRVEEALRLFVVGAWFRAPSEKARA